MRGHVDGRTRGNAWADACDLTCMHGVQVTSIPGVKHGLVNMGDPIYGNMHPTFTDFMGPGVLVTIGFVQAIGLTAIAFVQDRKEGLLDRYAWVA